MSKLYIFWAAGVGFSFMQIFFKLQEAWSRALWLIFIVACIYIYAKLPKELYLLYWIVLSIVTTLLVYLIAPDTIGLEGMNV